MNRTLAARLFKVFSAGLAGYLVGWILGWSALDPNSDVWALAAAVGAVAGLIVGITPLFWPNAGGFFGLALGLYLAWILRTWVFGDVPGGLGLIVVLGGGAAGWWAGAYKFRSSASRRAMIGALYAGFFGGFIIDIVMFELLFKVVQTHSVLSQAPAVIVCGVLGGWLAARRG